jgi:hypothetical protein
MAQAQKKEVRGDRATTDEKIRKIVELIGFPADTSPDMKLSRLQNRSVREIVELLKPLLEIERIVYVEKPPEPAEQPKPRGRRPKYT